MKSALLIFFAIHFTAGLIWWKVFIKNKITGTTSPGLWEAAALWAAFLGGIFILLYELIFEINKAK